MSPRPHCTPFSLSFPPPFPPQFGSGGGHSCHCPCKGPNSPLPHSSLHLFRLFWPHFSEAGQDRGPSNPRGDPHPSGTPALEGVPNLGGVPSSVGVPHLPGVPSPGGVPVSSGIPHLSGVPHLVWGSLTPWWPGGGPPESQDRGRGTPSGPPRFWGSTPPSPAPGFGGLPGLGGRRPPALTQPCSCSAPGRGRSPAAASLALVGGGN